MYMYAFPAKRHQRVYPVSKVNVCDFLREEETILQTAFRIKLSVKRAPLIFCETTILLLPFNRYTWLYVGFLEIKIGIASLLLDEIRRFSLTKSKITAGDWDAKLRIP